MNFGLCNSENHKRPFLLTVAFHFKNTLFLLALPMILETNMKDGTRPESLDVTYIVKGCANPPPTATWTLDDKEIKPDSNLRMKTSQNGEEFRLEIKKLDMKDAGLYKCILKNPLGDVKQQAILEVTRKVQ